MRIDEVLEGEVIADSYTVRVPIHAKISKKQRRPLNLNVYRNLHHFQLDAQKKDFAANVKDLLRDYPYAERVWIHYTIFAPSRRRMDTMNVGSVLDKYFCDVLVSEKKIPDDDNKHVIFSSFSFGGVSDLDGYALVTINILKKEKENMRIILEEDEIQSALTAFVQDTLSIDGASGVELSVDDAGNILAEVMMDSSSNDDDKPAPKKRGGRPKGSKNKPKEEPDVVEDPVPGDTGSGTDSGAGDGDTEEEDTPDVKEGVDTAEEKPASKNLFGESDTEESSASQTKSDETKEEVPSLKKTKTSIFDQ